MAMVNTFIPGLSPQNPHYIPGYTGHCPLLRFSVGQTYGQVTGQLLRGPPGLAWPPAHRTLLPPIRSPRSPVISRRRPPPRRGHERLSSSVVPGYTGFIPQARFIFAKNCNQVWAEAMSDFTQRRGAQESPELQEAKGEEEVERDQGPEAEEPQLKHELAQVRWGRAGGAGLGARCLRGARILFFLSLTSHQTSPYSMDDTDPQKFFMSGFTGYVPRARFLFGSSFPVLTNQALQEFGQMCSGGRVQKDPKPLSPLPRPNFQNLGLLPHYGGYVPGYKFQFGGTFGHLTHDALGLSITQKQLLA
ncbi:ciliary microtubule inner protein 2B isoform X1 [Rattus norvegicus]|uniref:ciliary microtubule inner protein 2B isoform X1 n=1 Tax=Rattus norvegicus TaxID=10116 RepID=UPI0019172B85|nr:protein FAM166B isoform X1 [Rattus norvegicus]